MSDEPEQSPIPAVRRGKIASFPAVIREELCRRLHDGERGPTLLPWLNGLPDTQRVLDEQWGEQPVTVQNLSEWRHGGYQDWLAKREKVENLRILTDYARKSAEAAGAQLSEGAAAIAGGRILELLESATEEDLVGLAIALAKLRDSDAKLLNARVAKETLARKDRVLALAEAKFQRETANLFLKWYEDEKARLIVEGKGTKQVKMEQLVMLMFGEKPKEGEDDEA